jgi:hypothetical protein
MNFICYPGSILLTEKTVSMVAAWLRQDDGRCESPECSGRAAFSILTYFVWKGGKNMGGQYGITSVSCRRALIHKRRQLRFLVSIAQVEGPFSHSN